jgi:hypothetical protein
MSKLRPAAWAALAVGAAILVFAFSGSASSVPAGYLPVTIAAGLQSLVHPANGNVSLLLPAGGAWVSAVIVRSQVPMTTPISTPAGSLPINVVDVLPGDVINLVWLDGARNQQTSILTFT